MAGPPLCLSPPITGDRRTLALISLHAHTAKPYNAHSLRQRYGRGERLNSFRRPCDCHSQKGNFNKIISDTGSVPSLSRVLNEIYLLGVLSKPPPSSQNLWMGPCCNDASCWMEWIPIRLKWVAQTVKWSGNRNLRDRVFLRSTRVRNFTVLCRPILIKYPPKTFMSCF